MDISLSTVAYTVEKRDWLGSRDGTEYTQSITLDVSTFTAGTHYPNGYIPSGMVLAKLSSGLYGPYSAATNEVQSATISGGPTSGTFTLTVDGETTVGIAYNATAAAVQTALEGIATVSPGDITVTGNAGGPYTLTFGGQYAGTNVPAVTADATNLAGGTDEAVTIATVTAGGASATLAAAEGFLFNSSKVVSADVGAPLLWRGVIKVANLPANNGLDTNARTLLAAKFRFVG